MAAPISKPGDPLYFGSRSAENQAKLVDYVWRASAPKSIITGRGCTILPPPLGWAQ